MTTTTTTAKTRDEERTESLREVGRAAMESIRELVAGLSKERAAKEWTSGLNREACLKALGLDEADQPHYVRDAGGEYLAEDGGRTPASDEAKEFDDQEDAEDACERETDLAVIVDPDERSIEELREAIVEAIVEDDEEPDGFEWDEDEARERVLDDALEVQVRGGWRGVGEKDDDEAEEFSILLTTGGPAVRIMGELSDGQPTRAWLEVQDWGTPWTEHFEEGAGEVLLEYASAFCFEE